MPQAPGLSPWLPLPKWAGLSWLSMACIFDVGRLERSCSRQGLKLVPSVNRLQCIYAGKFWAFLAKVLVLYVIGQVFQTYLCEAVPISISG